MCNGQKAKLPKKNKTEIDQQFFVFFRTESDGSRGGKFFKIKNSVIFCFYGNYMHLVSSSSETSIILVKNIQDNNRYFIDITRENKQIVRFILLAKFKNNVYSN